MSSKDQTRQKLMGSMRKTKAVAGIGGGNANSEMIAEDSKAIAMTEPASATNVKKAAPAKTGLGDADPYQSGRRVWPD